MINVHGVVL